ncbi:hypothetical protein D3791_06665 [Glutamicibacter mishrai]|uniref:Uncharacterized protein n=1 Tax=Glutamicibacter mishrai TaxID=1775880 RepID=A0A6H0SI80_9MICC|nr:hypothetical protein D3791_06665 [Glutamicibacter mishrai]
MSQTKKVFLINDATIKKNENRLELYEDIKSVFTEQDNLLACINRGVLVEELADLTPMQGPDNVASIIIRWLHSPESCTSREIKIDGNSKYQCQLTIETENYISYLRICKDSKPILQAVAVYADVCSLLEINPKVRLRDNNDEGTILVAPEYRIAHFSDREKICIEDIPAGLVIKQIISDITDKFDSNLEEEDPISANLKTLAQPMAQRGLLNILRSSEILNGKIMTYRDLWGIFARCIIGDLADSVTANPDMSLESILGREIRTFDEAKRMAALRFSEALFDSSFFGRQEETNSKTHPVLKMTRTVDPIRDSKSTSNNAGEQQISIAYCVSEAFSHASTSTSPLRYLLNNDLANCVELVTDFDRLVDVLYTEYISKESCKSNDVRKAISWYSRYLTRLFSLFLGVPAFREEIDTWTDAWNSSSILPSNLKEGLNAILIPNRDPENWNSKRLMPILDSRTLPVIGNTRNPKFAINADHVDLKTRRSGEELFLILEEKNEVVEEIVLDFPLVREALASSKRYPGLTELSSVAAPRIERFRSTRLSSADWSNKQLVIAHGNTDTEFLIRKAKKR